MSELKRAALGQVAALGALYDARSDTFLPELSLLKDPLPPGSVTRTDIPTSDVRIRQGDTYKERFEHMGVSAELGASFLAGITPVEGSGGYLCDRRDTNHIVQQSLSYRITTVREKLNLGRLAENLALETLKSSTATHVVTEVTWGAQTFLTAKYKPLRNEDLVSVQRKLRAGFDSLKVTGSMSAFENLSINSGSTQTALSRSCSLVLLLQGDVLPHDAAGPVILEDFEKAKMWLKDIPTQIARAKGGKGIPVMYTMLPIHILSTFLPVEIQADTTVTQIRPEYLEEFIQFCDEISTMQQKLNDYRAEIQDHHPCVPHQHIRATGDYDRRMKAAEAALKSRYAAALKNVRAGKADAQTLSRILQDIRAGDLAPERLIAVTQEYREKIDFVNMITERGAIYIGYEQNSRSLDTELAKSGGKDSYLFYISRQAREDSRQLWKEHVTLVLELLDGKGRKHERCVLVVDCDTTARGVPKLYKPRVSHYRNSKMITEDLLQQQKLLVDKCVIRCDGEGVDSSVRTKPMKRRAVKLPCPGLECSQNNTWEWLCVNCLEPVEYCETDQQIYCDCGRGHFDNYTFKCKNPKHGFSFVKYDTNKLKQLLSELAPFDELNILILGETGVGKSTFINAFINYQTFPSLQDAVDAEGLTSVIPCSFFTQYIDENDRLVETKVTVGSGHTDEEHDGTRGQSATQKTTVHALTYDSDKTIRLIDTPGIGDTRGLEHDKRNMADILLTLRKYDRLHGIMILLRSDKARLQLSFRFCIKELLTHLHRDAARNMVFCFTNSRCSNYQPGDTFKPLQSLLGELREIDIGLVRNTVYCFDSESFRYLAAHKQNVSLGDFNDYRRSWEKSASESQRLLKHFRTLTPHRVTGTLNLNSTRYLLARLTKPMADISQTITYSIQLNKDKITRLSKRQMNRAGLEKELYVSKVTLESRKLDRPRTVCSHTTCVKYLSDPFDPEKTHVNHITHCHNPCYLDDVEVDYVGTEKLMHCHAFHRSSHCRVCTHHWKEHLHVLYEKSEKVISVRSSFIEKELAECDNDIDTQRRGIEEMKRTIDEYQEEHEQIQTAAAHFCYFLKSNSITPYNDATIEYLDVLIKEEKGKLDVRSGGNRDLDRLQQLEKDRKEHLELVEAMSNQTESSHLLDEDGVHQLVDKLYGLPHFGDQLKNLADTVEKAHAETYREKPHHLKGWRKASQGQRLGPESIPGTSYGNRAQDEYGRRHAHPKNFFERAIDAGKEWSMSFRSYW